PPYLLEPTNYGSQEVDFGEGRASIGQATVTVIDPAQTPGDQDSGWLTERLADDLGLGAIQGRRCLLRRWAGIAVGWVVIVDGPAGVPRMDASYAAYGRGKRRGQSGAGGHGGVRQASVGRGGRAPEQVDEQCRRMQRGPVPSLSAMKRGPPSLALPQKLHRIHGVRPLMSDSSV